MSVPDWVQQAETWCASVEQSSGGLMLIGAVVTLGNALVFRVLVRRLRHAFGESRRLLGAVAIPYWLLVAPAIVMALSGKHGAHRVHELLPTQLAVACMAFQFAIWVYGGALLLGALPAWLSDVVRRIRRRLKPALPPQSEPADAERRGALRKLATGVPAVILTTAAAGGVSSQQAPVVRRISQRVRDDYSHLRGLKIVQFSDVHIGSYHERDRLEEITVAINALRPDLVVCTGDLIDNRLEQLEHAGRMLKRLRSPMGTYMCMGNHEYIAAQGREGVVRASYRDAGATLLVDEAHKLTVGGSHLWLAGTDFPGSPGGALGDRPGTAQSMDTIEAQMDDDGAPRIVLSHHPKTFFEARERRIDLMLSGHTHGGQISLGRIDDYALTPNLPFEFYHKGHYHHHGRNLYVNSGIGSWLPVRLNCPPEITVVELVGA